MTTAVQVLGRSSVDILRKVLSDTDYEVRAAASGKPLLAAVQTLNMTYEEASDLVLPLLNDSHDKVREAVGQAAAVVEKSHAERLATEAKESEVKSNRLARDAHEAEARAKEAQGEAHAKAEEAKVAQEMAQSEADKAKHMEKKAFENLEEAEIEKVKAIASDKAREKSQEELYEQQKEHDRAVLDVERKKIELEEKDRIANEQAETVREYKNLFIGARASSLALLVPLLASYIHQRKPREREAPEA